MNSHTCCQADVGIVLDAPYADLHIAFQAAPEHACMRARQLAALLLAIQPEDGPDELLWLAQQLAAEIAGTLSGMAGAAS